MELTFDGLTKVGLSPEDVWGWFKNELGGQTIHTHKYSSDSDSGLDVGKLVAAIDRPVVDEGTTEAEQLCQKHNDAVQLVAKRYSGIEDLPPSETYCRAICEKMGYQYFEDSQELDRLCGETYGIVHYASVFGDENKDDSVYESWQECYRKIGADGVTAEEPVSQAPLDVDVDMVPKRARHRVFRALNDGCCANCQYVATQAYGILHTRDGGLQCPSCSFAITGEEIKAIEAEFAPAMKAALDIFMQWRAERERLAAK